MRRRRMSFLAGALAGALAAVVTLADPVQTAAAAATGCDAPRPSVSAFYGPAASEVYDSVFQDSFAIPNLPAGYTPQGMTTWPLPNGSSLLILGEYKKKSRSLLVAIDPTTGRSYGTVKIAEAHLGGIAIVGNWLFAQDKPNTNHEKVRKYDMGKLAKAFLSSHNTGVYPYVGRTGALQPVYWASFMSSYGGHLYAGHHGIKDVLMYEYSVDSDGTLHKKHTYQSPPLTDGVVVTADRFIFVSHGETGEGYGRMLVADRSAHLGDHPVRCFAMPNLGEGAVLDHGTVYTAFESGSNALHENSADHIKFLHSASYSVLAQLLSN